jgi:endonuclease YncB( thermonuclease family)
MKKILKFCHFIMVLACLNIGWGIGLGIGFGTGYAPVAYAKDVMTGKKYSISGTVTITKINDGDSLRSGNLRIRLFGIDAPEKKQQCTDAAGMSWDCGIAAQKKLADLVANAPNLTCHLIDVDRYGRLVMRCLAGETDVAAALVRAGLALAYRKYSSAYIDDETIAKTTKSGIWAGRFTAPWDWRRAQ